MNSFVIAEAGANHNRDWGVAQKLINSAVDANASAVKFQTYSSETLYAKNTPDFAGYKNINKLIKEIELPREWQKDLKKYCDDTNIEFMSTPFDNRAVDELFNIGVKRFKIAGFEATDPRLVRYASKTKLPLIISAGIGCSLTKIKDILSWVNSENSDADVTILHCNNSYPTPFSDICLKNISLIKEHYPEVKVGLSDHTTGILVPPIAVALGASVIEKHYTLDRNMSGPDHPFAIEPRELKEMVKNIIIAEKCATVNLEDYSESEKKMKNARRSVVSNKDVSRGELASLENITTMRPFFDSSIPADQYYNCIGLKFQKDIRKGSVICLQDLM